MKLTDFVKQIEERCPKLPKEYLVQVLQLLAENNILNRFVVHEPSGLKFKDVGTVPDVIVGYGQVHVEDLFISYEAKEDNSLILRLMPN